MPKNIPALKPKTLIKILERGGCIFYREGKGDQSHLLELGYQQMLEYDIMTVHDKTITKIRQLPESLVQEVSDFVDFLLAKYNRESLEIAELDFSDYFSNLEEYEERLARAEIQW